jgi:NitT/TauT family transport system ATP-binding protein
MRPTPQLARILLIEDEQDMARYLSKGLEEAGYLVTHADQAPEARALALHWLERVGLKGFEDRYPHQLSGGMRKRVALAQTLVLDPDIILMDEPFSALDIQTRQLMENEVLDLWADKRKAVMFITHDLDEAIAMSDRVIVLSAGPATHPIGNFKVDLPRPRDVAEIRTNPQFIQIHQQIWSVLRDEVLKGYSQQLQAKALA